VRRVLEAGHRILAECVAAGGALTGEHGVGLEKLSEMELYFSPDDLAAACRMRDAWDPARRLNPGKVIPTHACLEVRSAARAAGGRA
jgi:FAD/FMN-containing dehydrogenase